MRYLSKHNATAELFDILFRKRGRSNERNGMINRAVFICLGERWEQTE